MQETPDETIPITESLDQIIGQVNQPLFVIGDTPVTIASILTFITFIALALLTSFLLRRFLSQIYRRRNVDQGMRYALNQLLHYVILALGILLAVENIGISLTALAAVGGILLVGIGFGLQNIAQNFIAGLILLIERPVGQGDFVEVEGVSGTVKQIRARATVISTHDDIKVIIPNGKFITEAVINRAYQDRYYRIKINVGVAYGSDTELVRDTLISVAKAHPDLLDDPAPTVYFEDFGEFDLNFRLMGWLTKPRIEPRVRSDLRFGVDKAFREAGIRLSLPQRKLHLESGWEKVRGG